MNLTTLFIVANGFFLLLWTVPLENTFFVWARGGAFVAGAIAVTLAGIMVFGPRKS